jgi:hypothetical protein
MLMAAAVSSNGLPITNSGNRDVRLVPPCNETGYNGMSRVCFAEKNIVILISNSFDVNFGNYKSYIKTLKMSEFYVGVFKTWRNIKIHSNESNYRSEALCLKALVEQYSY